MGVVYEHTSKFAESIAAYSQAAKIQPHNPNSWKGLLGICERTHNGQLYLTSTIGLIQCYEQTDDMVRAVDSLEKAKRFVKKYPWRTSEYDILELQLPGSLIYEYMEGRLPPPDETYSNLVAILEKTEKAEIAKFTFKNVVQIGKRTSVNESLYKIYSNSRVSIKLLLYAIPSNFLFRSRIFTTTSSIGRETTTSADYSKESYSHTNTPPWQLRRRTSKLNSKRKFITWHQTWCLSIPMKFLHGKLQ